MKNKNKKYLSQRALMLKRAKLGVPKQLTNISLNSQESSKRSKNSKTSLPKLNLNPNNLTILPETYIGVMTKRKLMKQDRINTIRELDLKNDISRIKKKKDRKLILRCLEFYEEIDKLPTESDMLDAFKIIFAIIENILNYPYYEDLRILSVD